MHGLRNGGVSRDGASPLGLCPPNSLSVQPFHAWSWGTVVTDATEQSPQAGSPLPRPRNRAQRGFGLLVAAELVTAAWGWSITADPLSRDWFGGRT